MTSKIPAIVLAPERYLTVHGKTAHGLVREGERFDVLAIIDSSSAPGDAGEKLDGVSRGIPLVANFDEAFEKAIAKPAYCVVGMATHGGRITPELKELLIEALQRGLHIVNGLHDSVQDDADLMSLAKEKNLEVTDLRHPPAKSSLHFWNGEILKVKTPRIAVLGTDCALGKRTTCRKLLSFCNDNGIKTEMIYTGQTGWLQGGGHGIIFDSLPNDFVSGELEHATLECVKDKNPDLILYEGQSSLRNPSGPCGSEFILSAGAKGVILQHSPKRDFFEGYEDLGLRIPSLTEEIELFRLYGAKVLAVSLNQENCSDKEMNHYIEDIQSEVNLPVVQGLGDLSALLPAIQSFMEAQA